MSKNTTDNTRELLRQFLFDYNMNTTAMGMDEEKALRGFLDSVMYLISNREKLLLDRLLEKRGNPADYVGVESVVPKSAIETLRKELDGEKPTNE